MTSVPPPHTHKYTLNKHHTILKEYTFPATKHNEQHRLLIQRSRNLSRVKTLSGDYHLSINFWDTQQLALQSNPQTFYT